MDTSSFAPAPDILNENVVVNSIDLKKSNYIDLKDYKIPIHSNGIFVVLEWLNSDNECEKKS